MDTILDEDEDVKIQDASPHTHHGHSHHHQHREGLCCSHDHSDEMEVYQMPTADKLEACEAFKKQGAMFFRETQWRRALNRYKKILVYLDYTFPKPGAEEEHATRLKKSALLNCAVCALRLNEYREAISLASQVIRDWEDTTQAWFLRGKAYRLLGEFDKARNDLQKCHALDPSNWEIRREILINDSDERCNEIWEADLAHEMFKTDPNTSATVQPLKNNVQAKLCYSD